MWQDWVFSVGQWIFLIALIPTLVHPTNKPPLSSSIPTALILYLFGFTYFTLDLWTSGFSSFGVATMWAAIAVQRYRLNRKNKEILE